MARDTDFIIKIRYIIGEKRTAMTQRLSIVEFDEFARIIHTRIDHN